MTIDIISAADAEYAAGQADERITPRLYINRWLGQTIFVAIRQGQLELAALRDQERWAEALMVAGALATLRKAANGFAAGQTVDMPWEVLSNALATFGAGPARGELGRSEVKG